MALPFAYILFALFEMPVTAAVVAGGAVGVPIIIHLLNRRRFKIVEWAAMRFLLAAQKKNSRRMRIEQLLLLLVRCLILLLLALSMMSVTDWAEKIWRYVNPSGGRGVLAGGTRTHKILVVDGSFSMATKVGDSTAFEQAREKALGLVREGSGNDGFSVVLMAAPPRRIVPRPADDTRKVEAELRALKMTHGNGDLAATLNTVASLLRESPEKFNAREVYFLTDMQRAGWLSPRPGDLTAALKTFKDTNTKAIFFDVTDGSTVSNLAVTSLELAEPVATTATETRIVASLFNHGDTRRDLKVRLLIGKAAEGKDKGQAVREVAETTVAEVPRNQQTPVNFTYRFPAAGDWLIQLQIVGDQLALDDQRSVVVRVKNTVPVLLVNGKPAVELFDRASEWMRVALNPFDEGERIPAAYAARPKTVSQRQFSELTDLTEYDGVVLCDLDAVSPGEVKRLEAHVRRGGALVVCLGGRADANAYNDVLFKNGEGLLPAKLLGLQRPTQGFVYQLAMDPEADRLDPLREFQDNAAHERLLMPHFSAFFQTEPARPTKGFAPRKILSFAPQALLGRSAPPRGAVPPPGGGAMWEWRPPLYTKDEIRNTKDDKDGSEARQISYSVPPSRGRVVLITTAVNAEWSNWPTSPAFPALMQETLYYAAAARLRERSLLVGEPIELHLTTVASMEGTVEIPADLNSAEEGAKRTASTQPIADGSVLRFGESDISGVYKITFGVQPREYLYAVNVPASSDDMQHSESNLARVTREELEKAYPEWDIQVVTESMQIKHATGTTMEGDVIYAPQGGPIAHAFLIAVLLLVLGEVVLAWHFGHYTSAAVGMTTEAPRPAAWHRFAWAAPYLFFVGLALVGFVLIHDAITGDFLSFLPRSVRGVAEAWLKIPPPAAGEGSRWRLEWTSYFVSPKADPWLAGLLGVLALVGIGAIYRREGNDVSTRVRVLFLALRIGLILLMLGVFLPQLKLFFERQGWPDLVILIDDSGSMSSLDAYRDDDVKAAADALAKDAELTEDEKDAVVKALTKNQSLSKASRLRLAQTFLLQDNEERLRELIESRQVRLHIYRCSAKAQRLAEVTHPGERKKAADAVAGMRADPKEHDSSQLGSAIRHVLNDFRGSSLAAIVTLTDGVTTEGEDIASAGKYAAQMGVPLYFVGIGDSHEQRDLYLHDLQAEDSVFVNDTIVFAVKVTGQGYKNLTVPVTLMEKGKERPLCPPQNAVIDPNNNTLTVQLKHKPTEPGEKVYVIKVPIQTDEVDRDNNLLEKTVYVRESKQIRVLYVEGYRRYEYHFIKTLLEREARLKGNKSFDLRVVLLDAFNDVQKMDPTVLGPIQAMPVPFENVDTHNDPRDLWYYDVVILGDVDPDAAGVNEHLKNLAKFVSERGGGLLMLAGERFAPRAYRNSPLKDILPIDLSADGGVGDDWIADAYRMELTPIGKSHPLFRFETDEKTSQEVWDRLKEFYWFADGYVPKRAAEVLATHPTQKAAGSKSGEKLPLIVQQFSGAGRCMLFGFNETWRWNWREDQKYFNHFWIQAMRYLARSKIGRIELRLDRQTPYRRGEPIKITVRFPDDEKPPPEKAEVKVVMERRTANAGTETKTLKLAKLDGSRATYDTIVTQTPEGEYRFWLVEPQAKPRPEATCKVLAPPGEMERLRMNQAEMDQAARLSQGKFYTLATAKKLAEELPTGNRVSVNAPGPPYIVWNSVLLFFLFLGVIGTEWLLRKLKNLL